MNYTIAQTLTIEQFKRRFGVRKDTLKRMGNTLKRHWRAVFKSGTKPKLGLEDRVLVNPGILARVSHLLSHWQQLGSEGIHRLPHCALG